jgi:ABC-type glycerol-3-phosphate transport system permease component
MAASFGSIRSGRDRMVWNTVSYAVLILISIATVTPFLFMVSTSFTESFTMMSLPPTLIPKDPSLKNYYEIIFEFQGGLFPRWFLNTVFTTATITIGGLLLNTLSGYIFAKKEFYGRNIVFAMILATLMVPNAVTLIPAFLMVNKLGLFNTYWAMIVPALSSAFGIFMMRQYISSLPTELIESAKMDGASELRTFWSIIIPLSLPGMAALGIFTVMNAWNAFLWPLLVLRSTEMRTLVVGLATVQSEFDINYGLVMAGSMLTVLPLLVIYIVFQPYFVEGLRLGYGK